MWKKISEKEEKKWGKNKKSDIKFKITEIKDCNWNDSILYIIIRLDTVKALDSTSAKT